MKTYTETPQGVVVEHNLVPNVNQKKGRNLRILYISLGVGIVLVIAGLVLLLIRLG